MSETIAAVFDLDRTLTSVRSVESTFIRFLVRNRHIDARNLARFAGFFVRNIVRDPVTATKRNKMYLKGISVAEADRLTHVFLEGDGSQLIPRESIALVNRHHRSGHLTILITGAPDFLARPLVDMLGIPFDHLHATRLAVDGNCYSGKIEGIHYYGNTKKALVRQLTSDLAFNLEESFCYADSESDIPMMSLFGKPVAVNPDKALNRESLRCNWRILTTG